VLYLVLDLWFPALHCIFELHNPLQYYFSRIPM
jgi:hypothetical protein